MTRRVPKATSTENRRAAKPAARIMPAVGSRSTNRGRLPAMLAVGLPAAALGPSGAARAQDGAPPTALLPNLNQEIPGDLTIKQVRVGRRIRHRLGFTSAVDNLGAGPIRLIGHRPSTRQRSMIVDQVISRSDGSTETVPGVGRLRYVRSEDHQHWHLLRFDDYQLRRVADGTLVRPARKTGFCLGDRYDQNLDTQLPGEPTTPLWVAACGKFRSRLLGVEQGISVGWGDAYKAHLEGQSIDITNLPAGRYDLVHIVNADRRLRESDYSDNAASLLIELSWNRAKIKTPTVTQLQGCSESARCPAAVEPAPAPG